MEYLVGGDDIVGGLGDDIVGGLGDDVVGGLEDNVITGLGFCGGGIMGRGFGLGS